MCVLLIYTIKDESIPEREGGVGGLVQEKVPECGSGWETPQGRGAFQESEGCFAIIFFSEASEGFGESGDTDL